MLSSFVCLSDYGAGCTCLPRTRCRWTSRRPAVGASGRTWSSAACIWVRPELVAEVKFLAWTDPRYGPGIGVLKCDCSCAAIGNGQSFARGRDLAAWLGLVPRQQTTVGKPRLKGITKRGNVYLRKLLIHGARAAMTSLSGTNTGHGKWLRGLRAQAHVNIVVVALANKLSRIAWGLLRTGRGFEAREATP